MNEHRILFEGGPAHGEVALWHDPTTWPASVAPRGGTTWGPKGLGLGAWGTYQLVGRTEAGHWLFRWQEGRADEQG